MTAIAHKPSPGTAPGGSVFRRPTAERGWKSWFTTVDHKKIGIMYYLTSLFFFLVGGIEALLIRTQLATPGAEVLTADQYDQVFTMHGLTMIFFAVIPLGTAFFNYLLPLQLGARDVAFPRMNALSYWVFLFAGLFIYSSLLFDGMPDSGWFGYAPLSIIGSDPSGFTLFGTETTRMAFYSLGLQIAGIASIASSVNLIVTILNMRAPGMTLMRMPIFAWLTLVTSFLLLFAVPIIGVALWELMFDVAFGASFFRPSAGGCSACSPAATTGTPRSRAACSRRAWARSTSGSSSSASTSPSAPCTSWAWPACRGASTPIRMTWAGTSGT